MTLKQILDELWGDPLVRCPKHITWWIETLDADQRAPNHLTKVENTGDIDLFYAPGRRVDLEARISKKEKRAAVTGCVLPEQNETNQDTENAK